MLDLMERIGAAIETPRERKIVEAAIAFAGDGTKRRDDAAIAKRAGVEVKDVKQALNRLSAMTLEVDASGPAMLRKPAKLSTVERLRASKAEAEAAEYAEGVEFGKLWAADDADFTALRNIVTLVETVCECCRDADMIETAATDDGDAEFRAAFWDDTFPDIHQPFDRPALLRGFVDGALIVWDQVSNEL